MSDCLKIKSVLLPMLAFALVRATPAVDLSTVFHNSSEVITTNEVSGTTPMMENFPMLLRISENCPKGFSYALAGDDGSRLRFEYQDDESKSTPCEVAPFEIEKWDTSGTSLVWVRHPKLNYNIHRRLVMYWNQIQGAVVPANVPASVWEGAGDGAGDNFGPYASVWHLTTLDGATTNPFATTFPSDFEKVTDGAVHWAKLSPSVSGQNALNLSMEPNGTVSALTNRGVTVSMWVKFSTMTANKAWLFAMNRDTSDNSALFAARFSGGTSGNDMTALTVYPGSSECSDGVQVGLTNGCKIAANAWTKIDVILSAADLSTSDKRQYVQVFVNGNSCGKYPFDGRMGSARTTIAAASNVPKMWFDELRVYPGVVTSNATTDKRLRTEVEQVEDASTWSFGPTKLDGVKINSWKVEPVITKAAWRAGESAAEVTNGVPEFGESEISYVNRISSEVYTEMPTNSGEYAVVFTVTNGTDYSGLEKQLNFTVAAVSDIHDTGYASAYDFAGHVTFEVTEYPEDGEAIKNFPMLIRIAGGNPKGFHYEMIQHGTDEIRFFDTNGKVLNYEIDTWNTDGESLIWVSVPTYRHGAKVTMCWGLLEGCKLPEINPKKVWSDYVGVWHFSEEIDSSTAATMSVDATGNGYDAEPKTGNASSAPVSKMTSVSGKLGNARRIASASTAKGSYLALTNSETIALGGEFTVSGWFKADGGNSSTTALTPIMTRKCNYADAGGWSLVDWYSNTEEVPLKHKSIGVYGSGSTHGIVQAATTDFANAGWVHFTTTYSDTNSVTVTTSDSGSWISTNLVNAATDNGRRIMFGGSDSTTAATLYGSVDEFRIRKGAASADMVSAEIAQVVNSSYYTSDSFTNDASAVLQNSWKRYPSMTRTRFTSDDPPTADDIDIGESYHGLATVTYVDRLTGVDLGGTMPTAVGEYRAVITVAEERESLTACYSGLSYEIAFRVVEVAVSHDLGEDFDRILLMNDDDTVEGGVVQVQGYDETVSILGAPYWLHQDASGNDASTGGDIWSTSRRFNFGGGTHHSYVSSDGEKLLWYMGLVRFGNTFNNGDYYPWEEFDDGLAVNQNYLPWNPESMRVVENDGMEVDGFHEYAGQAVMQNAADSQIASSCFERGIGTIYFDAVNGWTDNVWDDDGFANYRLVVEIATNVVNSKAAPYDENVRATYEVKQYDDTGKVTNTISKVYDPVYYADWHAVPMQVLRFDSGVATNLGETTELTLAVTNGGSYAHFYRIVAPVNARVPARFRIRRTAIDSTQSADPDGEAYILVDNVICSAPAKVAELKPCGRFDATRTGKNVLGYEAAFNPAFPCPDDVTVMGRAKGAMADGSAYESGIISAAAMHYRWRYLNQKASDWYTVDLDPVTLVSRHALELPGLPGDIEFWFDATQNGAFYTFADYTGLDLGLGGLDYSEQVNAITNRAPSYETQRDWFVRLRDAKAWYSTMKVLVKTSASATPEEVDLYVSGTDTWRGFYRMSKEIEGGILWRIEPRDLQTDGAADWNYSTNYWYLSDYPYTGDETQSLPTLPLSSRLVEGGADSWSVAPCDATTGYLMFQVDDSSRGVTVIHADYQDFNKWNDAAIGYFTGSSAETNLMKGVSANAHDYGEKYEGWADEVATNKYWSLIFDEELDSPDYPGYITFNYKKGFFPAWDLGKGRYVYGKYQEPASNVAFEMAGRGEGYIEMSSNAQIGNNWPRGIESISFNARLAQAVDPSNISYCRSAWDMTNYTFFARVCFDMKENRGFSGSASVSLFSYYLEDEGCYEVRWEQIGGKLDQREEYEGMVLGPEERGQRLAIFRWNVVGDTMESTLLFAATNSISFGFDMPTMSGSNTNNLLPMCVSTYKNSSGNTVIVAGVRYNDGGVNPTSDINGNYWYFATYVDSSAQRLTDGSYGVQSSNCEGLFLTPSISDKPMWPNSAGGKDKVASCRCYTSDSLSAVISAEKCASDIAGKAWSKKKGREVPFYNEKNPAGSNFGFAYAPVTQTLGIYTNKVNYTGAWNDSLKATTVTIDGFGTPGLESDYVVNLFTRDDVSIHIQTGGTADDASSKDVAISDVIVRQWRGRDNWSTSDKDWDFDNDRAKSSVNNYGRTNIVFTTGWVQDGMVELSAKRTKPGLASSVRSPLLDGYDNRGFGLGMMQITYKEPDKNIRLKVQIVTNYTYASSSLQSMSQSVSEGDGNRSNWHTVTNLTYQELWEDVLNKGETATYRYSFGLHGVRGMMRIAIDDSLASEVASETNSAKFGSIKITQVECRDEQPLDKYCWWGWNIQTIGDLYDTQKRMYIYDCGADPAYIGMSMAINNSVYDDIDPAITDIDTMREHMPFVQSPTFTNAVIGQISFKARKYDISKNSPDAEITVYATRQNPDLIDKDTDWDKVVVFKVTNSIYTAFNYKMDGNNSYRALRLAVTGVAGVNNPGPRPSSGGDPVRVLIDEVSVSEAVKAMLAFRHVGAFRHDLKDNVYVPGVTTKYEQPLCGENWGIQAEVFATMLEDEIDRSYVPRVKLNWYVTGVIEEGAEKYVKWGYENWKDVPIDRKTRGEAYLAEVDGSNYVYRSSYAAAPDAVMLSQENSGTVVQYMLEVEYKVVNSFTKVSSLVTNRLDGSSWTVPDWYAPVDYNANPKLGKGMSANFAAYTILDTVAPKWAWINEVNVYGGKKESGSGNADSKYQYVELCVPADADITGWKLRLFSAYMNGTVMTNNCSTFSNSGHPYPAGTKTKNMKANKTFRLIANSKERLSYDNGTLDGIWSFSDHDSTFFYKDNVDQIETEMPFGVQLVRASGVIEDSVVVVGTNYWGRLPGTKQYDPENIVKLLNKGVPGSSFRYVAEDCMGAPYSGSVTSGGGATLEGETILTSWANDWACSPGFVNTNYLGAVQDIDPDHPTPQGDRIIIYASVDTSLGHIYHSLGEGGAPTAESQMVILEKGSSRGTNIVYTVDPWFELKSVTTNEVAAWGYGPRVRRWEFKEVGKGASNNISVVATAQVDSDLRDKYGLTSANPYTPAVMAWLLGNRTLKDGGTDFAHPGEIAPLADYLDMADNVKTNLTLTQMYWLDMDPTVSNLALKAGMVKISPVEPPIVEGYLGSESLTNRRMTVYMAITNRNTGEVWSPYVMRGLEPGYSSLDYKTDGPTPSPAWTSVTFKVTGILANGLTRESNLDDWIPLRWFVFHKDSFYQPGDEDGQPFTSEIEIVDPYSISSPGSDAGWYRWCHDPDHPERANTPIFNRWSIDERLKPVGVEILKKRNWYEE